MTGWTSSPIRARTATTASRSGGPTSARPSGTTPWRSAGATSPSRAGRSCGRGRRGHGRSRSADPELAWTAEHDGYAVLSPATVHRRSVRLDRAGRAIEITDVIDGGGHDIRMAFHLGPDVAAELVAGEAVLSWQGPTAPGAARLELPGELEWQSHRGETRPDPRVVLGGAWRARSGRDPIGTRPLRARHSARHAAIVYRKRKFARLC